MRKYVFIFSLVTMAFLTGCQSISSQEKHVADEKTCSGYGYKAGSQAYADCMMSVNERRQDKASVQRDDDAMMKALSIRRNGNERYSVCTASMIDVSLDIDNNAWYGPDCREK